MSTKDYPLIKVTQYSVFLLTYASNMQYLIDKRYNFLWLKYKKLHKYTKLETHTDADKSRMHQTGFRQRKFTSLNSDIPATAINIKIRESIAC